ncbi:MAG: ribosomal protein L11 methyltransferase [Armatimonadota bacterium]|nr:MAG: ribosomal protein L11 methyltransferase [Armatimonadota bacterium]
MKWLEMGILVHPISHEAVAEVCRQAGVQGVRLESDKVVVALPVDGRLDERKRWLLTQLSLLPEWGLPPMQRVEERVRDESEWADAWKQFFHTFRVGSRIVIQPSWEPYTPRQEDVVIELDPGMAFGTGLHETTQLCLDFLEEMIQTGVAVVDVGTGSGILAIAAAKLGASSVWAGDNDPVAVLVAQRNVARNRVEKVVSVHLAEGCEGAPECDLLVANITAEVILQLLPDFARCSRRGGSLIVSGIVEGRQQSVRRALSQPPWHEMIVRKRGDWWAFAARRG